MLNLIAFSTPSNVYFTTKSNYGIASTIVVNGQKPSETFKQNWFSVEGNKINSVKENKTKKVRERLELRNKNNSSLDFLPRIIYLEGNDNVVLKGYEFDFVEEYVGFESFYDYKYETENVLEDVEFSVDYVLELKEDVSSSIKQSYFNFDTYVSSSRADTVKKVGVKPIKSQIVDEIIFPGPLLALRPCKISGEEFYDIVRYYVKNNINPIHAKITADYEFCFTVEKVIPLAEPIEYTVDVNNNFYSKRKRTPKYEKRYRNNRTVTVFSCAPKSYQSYPVLQGLEGKTYEDLENKIQAYLDDLINEINKPVVDCPHCNGTGVVLDQNSTKK